MNIIPTPPSRTSQSRCTRRGSKYAILALPLLLLFTACSAPQPTPSNDVSSLFSGKEVAEKRLACLQEKGWDVNLEEGAIVGDIPVEQKDKYQADSDVCAKEAGIDPNQGMTDEQYEVAYIWYSDIAKCLDERGWATPDKPSPETFRSTYDADPWIPWSMVPDADFQRAQELCPVMKVPSN